ncbi:MAG: ATP-binding cassette domain-containing protein [Deltaproteobacteria bacterium]|jgi:putative ABC transport system ATP-binding protein|nr:ATP-binding cassette domain-containing protein [Deltaproteobacteria bacterium]
MLKVRGLSKYFARGTANELRALCRLDLDVRPGEFVSVIGSNGAGKSTLLACIAGAAIPDEGRIVLDGTDITGWPEHRRAGRIGRVFQDPLLGTCASMTIEENMALAQRRGRRRTLRAGITRAERARFREALGSLDLGLDRRLGEPCGFLSGGQRQSLTLLMATLVRPSLLLLDEHTAALDPRTAGLVMRLTCDVIERDRLTAVMITHNMQQALSYGQRLIMMHRGEVCLDFSAEEKSRLTVQDLIYHFHAANPAVQGAVSDRMILS